MYITRFVSAGSQGYTLPRSQATSYFLKNSDSVLHESKKSGIPSQPLTVCHAVAQDDRTQWKHDQAHVVSPSDPQPHTQGYRCTTHVPWTLNRHGRVHRNAYQARRRVGKRISETFTQP